MLPRITFFLVVIGQAFAVYNYNTITMCRGACGSYGQCTLNSRNMAYECQCYDRTLVHTGRICEPCPAPCTGGVCDVQPGGGATCLCPPGTFLVNGQCFDQRMECQLSCVNGQCQNVLGRWQCFCPQGLVLVGGACRPCPVPCQNGLCQENRNGAVCLCPPDTTFINGQCVPNKAVCEQTCVNGYCLRTGDGSWVCNCPPGRTLINGECVDKRIICQQSCLNGICQQNALGNWLCTCPPGFQANNGVCTDINECATGLYCANGQCINLPGSFRCQCALGFEPSFYSKTCKRIFYPCICNGGYCVNVGGVNQCTCPFGYMLEGTSQCVDINECLGDPCIGGQCVNYAGGHTCRACLQGFVLSPDAKRCLPINTETVTVPRPGSVFPWWLFFIDR
ncbi:latent-transforming growth factor beta-binding protein 1-like [Littorina saxatilis]|uniref:EGF-like domain-containing protein n=1 Tax=Littorina saxatilis TaxID=31220 RepID=A0AAN9AU25_9CAEN